jgi:hypothetical protein
VDAQEGSFAGYGKNPWKGEKMKVIGPAAEFIPVRATDREWPAG